MTKYTMESTVNKSNANRNKYWTHFEVTVVPIYLSIHNKDDPQHKSKCISMILDFNNNPQNVGKISFKNYYTYTMAVLVEKILHNDPNKLKKWYVAIEKKVM